MNTTLASLVLATGLAAALSGCAAPPQGEPTGRADVYDTTPAERADRQILPSALAENSDQVAEQLAADLSSIPELSQYRCTVVFGDLANKTGIVPTTDFEAFRQRTRQKLMQSRLVNNNIRFIENRARFESLQTKENIGSGGTDSDAARNVRNPEYTFFLNGSMYRVSRGANESVNLYEIAWELMRASDGSLVWSSAPYEIKQIR
mgnify:CR=1 FL=1